MGELKITLVGDGSSDKTLQEVIKWLISDLYPRQIIKIQFADLGYLPTPPPKSEPQKQVQTAKKYYPYDRRRDGFVTGVGSLLFFGQGTRFQSVQIYCRLTFA